MGKALKDGERSGSGDPVYANLLRSGLLSVADEAASDSEALIREEARVFGVGELPDFAEERGGEPAVREERNRLVPDQNAERVSVRYYSSKSSANGTANTTGSAPFPKRYSLAVRSASVALNDKTTDSDPSATSSLSYRTTTHGSLALVRSSYTTTKREIQYKGKPELHFITSTTSRLRVAAPRSTPPRRSPCAPPHESALPVPPGFPPPSFQSPSPRPAPPHPITVSPDES